MKLEDIQSKMDMITDSLEKLNILKRKTYEDFISDFRNIDSALHRLQISIQALLDIGSYIIASMGLRTPNTNAEIIEILTEAGYIPKNKRESYIKMSQFRNRIVHLYNQIDLEVLYEILAEELGEIKDFLKNLLNIIEKNP
ncbi:MAG: type VII toxin-antitoxin system HepT family RNase toxin [Candidatus Jordarchaeum sp.]|uniref:type VII toxin-antitoxin system HepT family RNase toxin n=1 Tax=Candidatus Jordarchaeum sp. TaxID=2823881 RepID=UPI00404B04BE